MAALVVGPELDAAVAKACGLKVDVIGTDCVVLKQELWRVFPEASHEFREFVRDSDYRLFNPSEDNNVVFKAAEKVGLFYNVDVKLSKNHYDGWTVEEVSFVRGQSRFKGDSPAHVECIDYGTGPTPALAICAAIIALAEQRNAQA